MNARRFKAWTCGQVLEASGPADDADPIDPRAKQHAREICIDASDCPTCGAPTGQPCYRTTGRAPDRVLVVAAAPYRTPHRARWLPFLA